MGAEAQCNAQFNGKISEGKAQLETDFLLFRGDYRVKVPLKSISSIAAEDGRLNIESSEGTLQLHLGPAAAKWLEKIRNPPSLADKLGIKPGAAVSVMGDEKLLASLEALAAVTPTGTLIFAGIESTADLSRIPLAAAKLEPKGALWVVWPKGQKHITEAQILSAVRQSGLVDIKVAAFSPTHTATKFVIPVAKRTHS